MSERVLRSQSLHYLLASESSVAHESSAASIGPLHERCGLSTGQLREAVTARTTTHQGSARCTAILGWTAPKLGVRSPT